MLTPENGKLLPARIADKPVDVAPQFFKIRSMLTPYWQLWFVLVEFLSIKTIVSYGRVRFYSIIRIRY